MSKHEQRAPRQSQLKLKVEGKDSAVQLARTGVLLAPKQQLPPQMARTDLLQHVQSLAPNQHSNRMRNICRNGARSEADLAQCGALALPPPFLFFVAVGANFFFNAPFLLQEDGVLKSYSTITAEIFVRDLISYFSYFRLKVRNLVEHENHTRITVYAYSVCIQCMYTVNVSLRSTSWTSWMIG